MTPAVSKKYSAAGQVPKLDIGLTPLLSELLDSRGLGIHRAEVAFEQEVLAKKVDRFGWDRDAGTPAHDRLVLDWMRVLQDFPIEEVRDACAAAIMAKPTAPTGPIATARTPENIISAKTASAIRSIVSSTGSIILNGCADPDTPRPTPISTSCAVDKTAFRPRRVT